MKFGLYTFALLASISLTMPSMAQSLPFFVGTGDKDIYASSLQTDTGQLAPPRRVADMRSPGFVWIHPSLPVLYAVGAQGKESQLAAFSIGENQQLTEMASVATGGAGACFVTVSPDGRYAAVAHYGSGSVAIFPLADDGTPSRPSAVVQHTGGSVDAKRQDGPHAHSVRFDASGKRLMGADLGTDKLYLYDVTDDGGLHPASPPAIALPPGSGPRHFVVAPGGEHVLILNELAGTVCVAPINPATGQVTATVSSVDPDLSPEADRASAEILFHPGGRFVYASNRAPGEIAWFTWDGAVLTRRGGVDCGGDWPRNFRISPDGKFLLVANQKSGDVVAFTIDPDTGEPTANGAKIEIPAALCIKFN